MNLFRLDASIFPATSASAEIADIVERKWRAAHEESQVKRRHVASEPFSGAAWADAITAQYIAEEDRTPAQSEALALTQTLVVELTEADAVLLAVPLYNFGVSQHVKAWIDLVIAGAGPTTPVLAGKPTVLATAKGGGYGAGTPREGWDHSTPYLRRVLEDMWGADLTIVERELTLANTTPAMESLRPLAAEVHEQALEAAHHAGEVLHKKSLAVQAS